MATYTKYNTFVENLANKQIDVFGATDVLRAIIHTDPPAPTTDNALSDFTEIMARTGTRRAAMPSTHARTTDTVSVLPDPTTAM
jgi:hypothetical protein